MYAISVVTHDLYRLLVCYVRLVQAARNAIRGKSVYGISFALADINKLAALYVLDIASSTFTSYADSFFFWRQRREIKLKLIPSLCLS